MGLKKSGRVGLAEWLMSVFVDLPLQDVPSEWTQVI